jgi:hypothetical protein
MFILRVSFALRMEHETFRLPFHFYSHLHLSFSIALFLSLRKTFLCALTNRCRFLKLQL